MLFVAMGTTGQRLSGNIHFAFTVWQPLAERFGAAIRLPHPSDLAGKGQSAVLQPTGQCSLRLLEA